MRRVQSVTAIVVLLLGAACGGADAGGDSRADSAEASAGTAAAPAASPDPCAVLTQEEMSAAIGTSVTGTERTASTRCLYKTDNPLVYVDLEVDRENADAAWQGTGAGNAAIGAQQDTVAGLGAEALFGPRDRLYVRAGSAFVGIEAGFDDQVRARARKVAAAVLPKLR